MSLPISKIPKGFISIIGADAEHFLQGQSSCDLSELDTQHFTYGTLNTPKGRMYAFFKAIRIDQGLLLALHPSTLELSLSKLKKYSVFFKCELSEAHYNAYGFHLSDTEVLHKKIPELDTLTHQLTARSKAGNDKLIAIMHPGKQQLIELWCTNEISDVPVNNALTEQWLADAVMDGIPELYAETQDTFILQELNLQELGAVSFKKGCYTGQEIIARMKYLGKLKKRMFALVSTHASAISVSDITPGTHIYLSSGEKVGKLVRIHQPDGTTVAALAVLNQDKLGENSEVYLEGFESSTLKVQPLIYES